MVGRGLGCHTPAMVGRPWSRRCEEVLRVGSCITRRWKYPSVDIEKSCGTMRMRVACAVNGKLRSVSEAKL